MKLRHVLFLASAVGACGALLLAADMFRRLKEAENALLLKGVAAGKEAGRSALLAGSAANDESVLSFLTAHALGLVALAFLFTAILLLLVAALRERAFAAAVGQVPQPDAAPEPERSSTAADLQPAALVMPLADMAQQDEAASQQDAAPPQKSATPDAPASMSQSASASGDPPSDPPRGDQGEPPEADQA